MTPARLGRLSYEVVAGQLGRFAGNVSSWLELEAAALIGVLASLGGDPLAYPLSAEDLAFYPDATLRAMAGLAEAPKKAPKTPRADLVAAALEVCGDLRLPEEFRSLLTPAAAGPKRKAKAR